MKNFSFHHLLWFVIHGQLSTTETNSQNIYIAGRSPDALLSPTIRSSSCMWSARTICFIYHWPVGMCLASIIIHVLYQLTQQQQKTGAPVHHPFRPWGLQTLRKYQFFVHIQQVWSQCEPGLWYIAHGSHLPQQYHKCWVLLHKNVRLQSISVRLLLQLKLICVQLESATLGTPQFA